MSVDPPKIDKRDYQKLLEEARQLVPFYVPEWDISHEDDSGFALLRVFCQMLLEVTRRLNQVPRKNFIAFLDMLGVKQIPSQPSRVPLIFQLTEGAPDVLIPELTQAEAPATEEREALVFETEKTITATTAALTDIYSVVPENDEIFDHSEHLANDEVFELFTNENQQEHALYLGHEDLFNITGKAQIQIGVKSSQPTNDSFPDELVDHSLVSWQYYGKEAQMGDGQEAGAAKWHDFSDFGNEYRLKAIILVSEFPKQKIRPSSAQPGQCLDIIIFGSGFQGLHKESVTLSAGIVCANMEVISDLRLRVQIVVIPDAKPGQRDVIITNPNGDILAKHNFRIDARGIYPEIGYQGESDLHIRYLSDFQNVDIGKIKIEPSDNNIKIIENSIELISDFQLEFCVSISSDAECGHKLMRIILPKTDGQPYEEEEDEQFIIAERPQRDINPGRAFQGDAIGVDLFGIFKDAVGADVSVECGEGMHVISVDCINQSRLHLQIAIDRSAQPGERTIRAFDGEWRFYIDERLQKRVEPRIVYQGEVIDVRINEGVFGVNAEIEFTGAGILVTGAEIVSTSQLLVRMRVDNNALAGARDILIKNPGIILLKEDKHEIIPCYINGIDSRWIRCFMAKIPAKDREAFGSFQINAIEFMSLCSIDKRAEADLLLNNDVPLTNPSPEAPVYPFGKQPRLYNAFYIASQESFSKKGATIGLHIEISRNMLLENVKGIDTDSIGKLKAAKIEAIEQLLRYTAEQLNGILITGDDTLAEQSAAVVTRAAEKHLRDNTPTLSWEYWNGSGWQAISDLEDTTISLSIDGTVTFTCPKDIAPTSVSGQENYWIRARITGGSYGKEKFIPEDTGEGKTWKVDTSDITVPRLHRLSIKYTMRSPSYLQHCLIHNNLEFQDVTRKSKTESDTFQPFLPIPDSRQAIYLGFDKPFPNSNVSFFLSLEEQLYLAGNRPRLLWYYYAQRGEWTRLGIVDDTESLTRSGTIELIGPSDFALVSGFGKERHWLKAVDSGDSFNSDDAPAPRVKGIYINSTWATQATTIRDEVLGSSDGTQFQVFQFTQTPALDETVQVNEKGSISEEEKEAIVESQGRKAISEVADASGEVSEIWIQWKRVDDFFDSTSSSRHYVINPISGEIQFGDGIRGMIPPGGSNNVRATYRTGGGKAGNIEAAEVQDIVSSIAFVGSVNNPYIAGGGSDAETLDEALERGPQALRNRGRAVTAEDYEWLAKEAFPDIARAKCLPNFKNVGDWEPGWVTLIIVPESKEEKPIPSPMLRRKVTEYLRERCSGMVAYTSLQVVGPAYIRISINAEIYPASINLASDAEEKAREALKAFLHPLTGGEDGTGWEFGRMVHFSDIYALLEGIEEIDHVGPISMSPVEVDILPYALIYSGEHEIIPRF